MPDTVDPIAARIARILESKRRGNAEMLSALNVAEEAWERLNKEVDTAIGSEFDLLTTEHDAVLAAKDRLENPDAEPTDKGFVFTGRVFDRSTRRRPAAAVRARPARGRRPSRSPTGSPTPRACTAWS